MADQTPGDNETNNPGEQNSRRMFSGDTAANLSNQENNNNDWENNGKGPDMKPPEAAKIGEESPRPWSDNTTPGGQAKQSAGPWYKQAPAKLKAFAKRPTGIMTLVGGGGIGLVFAFMSFIIPNQINMAISNVMSIAGGIPEYATQQRGEYIATRYLASRVLALSGEDFDTKMIFCKGGGITCSLTTTKFAEAFDKKYGLTVTPKPNGVITTVKPQGRAGLGGKAVKWEVTWSHNSSIDGKLRNITTEIKSNKNMKKFINFEVKKAHNKNYLTRYIAKRILMKRYGVTHFRVFEGSRNKLALKASDYQAKLAANTVGKILPKMPAYMACLQGGESRACQSALGAATASLDKKRAKIDEDIAKATTPEEINNLKMKKNGIDELQRGIKVPDFEGKFGKMISKNLIKAGGPLLIYGVFDLAFEIIEGVDSGSLEQVSFDVMSQAYNGYAFGDDVGIVTNADMMRTEGHDMDSLGVLTSTLEGMGESPLYQERTGQFAYDSSATYSSECDVAGGKREVVNLRKGDLVCPEEKMVKTYTDFREDSRWGPLASLAIVWNRSAGLIGDLLGGIVNLLVGPVIDIMGAVLGAITSLPGLSNAKDFTVQTFQDSIEWVLNSAVGMPDIGPEGRGSTNYVALDGAITKSLNDTMENGVESTSGDVMGAGGRVLSKTEKMAIETTMLSEEREEFNNQSVMAKIFNGNLRGSMVNKLAIVMPTNMSGILGFGPKLLGNMSSILSSNTYAASGVYNPHGFPLYGYGPGDRAEVFEADPSKYTADECAKSAKKREDSFTLRDGDTLPTYGEIDPCALEKIVVGAMLDEAGITTDVNSIKEADSEQMNVSSNTGSNETPETETSTGDLVDGASWPVEKRFWDNRKGQFLSAHGTSSGTFTTPGRNGYAIDLGANSVFTGERPPVYSMFAGRVSRFLCGTTSSVIISSTINGKSLQVAYAHMVNGNLKGGETVSAGQKIGTVGALGCKVNGAHLHMDMSYDGRAVCPQDVFKDMGDNKPLDFERYTKQIRTGCGVR